MDQVTNLAMREALFVYMDGLTRAYPDGVPAHVLQQPFSFGEFTFRPLQQAGIFKPSILGPEGAAVVLTSSLDGPYNDVHDRDSGFLQYRYQGGRGDEDNHFNRSLRQAIAQRVPLLYLCGIDVNLYLPLYPAYVILDDRINLSVSIQVVPRTLQIDPYDADQNADILRRYATRIVNDRLHQKGFRKIVMKAYQHTCAMCSLKIADLLDAAHIIADGEPNGDAVVANGLSLCKIHHRAYDLDIVGVSPDYRIAVNSTILREIDGPMLKHGIQELNNNKLILPKNVRDQPDPDRLDFRYQKFLGQ